MKEENKNYMSIKERCIATIRKEPVDRLPFWPKIGEAYLNAQSAPFNRMKTEEFHIWLGTDPQIFLPSAVIEKRTSTEIKTIEKNGIKKIEYITKYGSTENILKYDPVSCAWHPGKMAIESLKDIEVMIAFFEDSDPVIDKDILKEAKDIKKREDDNALFVVEVGESPFMEFMEYYAGMENAHLLVTDYPSKVEKLFSAMHRILLKKAEIISGTNPADTLYFIENTSTTVMSPMQFRKYPLEHLKQYGEIIMNSDKMFLLHMCGYLKGLLPDIDKIAAHGIEAFTSPPVGNTRLIDGKKLCPSKSLIGGTNAVLWLKSAKEIIEELEKDLDELDNHRGIYISSGGAMPPMCKPETIREVGEFIKSYKLRQ